MFLIINRGIFKWSYSFLLDLQMVTTYDETCLYFYGEIIFAHCKLNRGMALKFIPFSKSNIATTESLSTFSLGLKKGIIAQFRYYFDVFITILQTISAAAVCQVARIPPSPPPPTCILLLISSSSIKSGNDSVLQFNSRRNRFEIHFIILLLKLFCFVLFFITSFSSQDLIWNCLLSYM